MCSSDLGESPSGNDGLSSLKGLHVELRSFNTSQQQGSISGHESSATWIMFCCDRHLKKKNVFMDYLFLGVVLNNGIMFHRTMRTIIIHKDSHMRPSAVPRCSCLMCGLCVKQGPTSGPGANRNSGFTVEFTYCSQPRQMHYVLRGCDVATGPARFSTGLAASHGEKHLSLSNTWCYHQPRAPARRLVSTNRHNNNTTQTNKCLSLASIISLPEDNQSQR